MYICPVCGYTHEGEPPEVCPVCGAVKKVFQEIK
ncbi:MAG: rubredoxin-like domain-containing protein [Promethearchaeota archaeon]